ncbi:MAG TPA: AAA family ATPase [Pyrinomonadaceae bacterium]|nr:AAA family ATPase [Pyrinomonadaceae bacterium]
MAKLVNKISRIVNMVKGEVDFGLRLREAFRDASQSEIARQLGVSNSAVTNYVEGRIPPAEMLTKIADLTGYSIHWLITGEGPRRSNEHEAGCQTIAFVNEKGGSAKSTSAVMLSIVFAKRGYRTLLVDARQGSCAVALYGDRTSGFHAGPAAYHKKLRRKIRMRRMYFRTEIPRLHLCSSNKIVNTLLTQHGEESFSIDIADIKKDYDFVLIDTDPAYVPFEALDLFTFSLLNSAQVLIPVRAHISSLRSVERTLKDLGEAGQSTVYINLLGAFLTVYYPDRKTSLMMVDELNKLLPGKILETIIPEGDDIAELGSYSQSELVRSNSRGFVEYSRLADEVLRLMGKARKMKESQNTETVKI